MKKLAVVIIAVLAVLFSFGSVSAQISTETSFKADEGFTGVDVNRVSVKIPNVSSTYDLKTNINGQKVNDVFSLFYTEAVNTKNFTFEPGFIKLGDMKEDDEYFVDLFAKIKFNNFSISAEIGQGVGEKQAPRSYFISRFSHSKVTTEIGFVTKKGYNNLEEVFQDKYYWLGYHPDNLFFALGNNINTTWAIASTRDLPDFGNLTFLSVDRKTGNFWMRSQTGILSANKGFFSLENLVSSASYLIVTPFHYKHFSPSSTKGLYSIKLDVKKVENIEKKEILFGRQFGQFGQVSLGGQNEIGNGNGFIAEYFNSIQIGKFVGSLELRYETLAKKLTGFTTLKYNL